MSNHRTYSGYALTQFKTTPPTSTYLIAFLVSDFPNKESWSKNGFRHRVFAKPNGIESGTFAVHESEKILNAIGDYVQINFTLPKMDSAAIPDFRAGGKFDRCTNARNESDAIQIFFPAMENWGLVTYREEALLYNETIHSNNRKIYVATTIAHGEI